MDLGYGPVVPPAFAARLAGRAPEPHVAGDDWLAGLPGLVAAALDRWDVRVDGPSRYGQCALVLPVRRAGGEPAALKLTWPHAEAEHEHLALRAWAGRGAVALLAAHPADGALLLEALDAERPLSRQPVDESCLVLGGLLRRLTVPAFGRLGRLSSWASEFLDRTADVRAATATGVPRRFVEQARSLAADLRGEPGVDAWLVHTDLHDDNVLAASRAPWLAIDPKPLAAEPAFALAPVLWNRWDDARAAGDATRHLRHRLGLLCEAAGVDEDRARAWSIVRLVSTGTWLGGGPRATPVIAALKAMQAE